MWSTSPNAEPKPASPEVAKGPRYSISFRPSWVVRDLCPRTLFSRPDQPYLGSVEADRSPLTEQLHQSSGSYELVLSAVILGIGGFFLDRWLGTTPIFMLTLTVLGFVGSGLSIYYRYKHQIASLQAATASVKAETASFRAQASKDDRS